MYEKDKDSRISNCIHGHIEQYFGDTGGIASAIVGVNL